jgi:hypothetical protein
MSIFNKETLLIISLFFVFACSTKQELVVDYSNPQITYSGRIDSSKVKGTELYWSGTSIQINFEGNSIYGLFEDERGDNYYNVIIDNDSLFILRTDTTKGYYQLASDLSKGKHSIEIFKRTEWNRGKTTFYGFQIKGNPRILPKSKPRKKKIEFYGNSITAGYAIEDFSGNDSPDSTYTNNYLSYAPITARYFDAQYQCICKSGIGIMISWFPLTMPEMYDRLVPEDATSQWDFSLYTPDIVVINLFQNDSWLVNMPDNAEFKAKFGTESPDDAFIVKSYINFIRSIRSVYPEAQIICALGNMDATSEGSKWPDYITAALKEVNDPKIYTHFMPYKDSPGHPTIKEQEVMANSLIKFIEDNIVW